MSNLTVPDLLSYKTMSRQLSSLKTRMNTTSVEAVTGQYEDVTAAAHGDIGGVHLVKKALEDVQSYQKSLTLAASRATATQTALDNLNTEGGRLATQAISAIGLNDDTSLKTTADDARAAISSIFSSLNTRFGGRALFGGDVTDASPLADPQQLLEDVQNIVAGATDVDDANAQLDAYFNDPNGGFETTIYQGGDGDIPGAEISAGIRVTIAAKANDQEIKDLIRGLATLATYESAGFADKEALAQSGAEKTLNADGGLTRLRANIGVSQSRIESATSRYQSEESVLTQLYNNKTARDPYEAASSLQLLQNQIEASYVITARLAGLTLTNYLG